MQNRRTALHLASRAGHVPVVKALLEARADVARYYAPNSKATAIAQLLTQAAYDRTHQEPLGVLGRRQAMDLALVAW